MSAYRYNHGYLKTTDRMILRAEHEILVVTAIVVCNTNGGNESFDLQHVQADESPDDQHKLFNENTIGSKVTQIIDTPFFMLPGDEMHALASVNDKITMTFYVQTYNDWLRRP